MTPWFEAIVRHHHVLVDVLAVLGVVGTFIFGWKSTRIEMDRRKIDAAFVAYHDLQREVDSLRQMKDVNDARVAQLEALKADVFRLKSAHPATEQGRRLGRAAERREALRQENQRQQPPPNEFLYTAEGDQTGVLHELGDELGITSAGGSNQLIKVFCSGNRTFAVVRGAGWKRVLDGRPGWAKVPPAKGGEVAGPVLTFISELQRFERGNQNPTGVCSSSGGPSDDLAHFTFYVGDTQHRLGLIATIEEFRPVTVSRYFKGASDEVEREYWHWVNTTRLAEHIEAS